MSHREEQSSRSKIDCGASRSARRTSADTGCSSDRCRQHETDSGGFMQDIPRQKNAIKDLECKLEWERRQNKETVDELLRQRNALQYRYKMKELRIQEVMLQFKQFKDNQAPTYQRLRQCFLEPSVNLIFEKMKAEVDENKRAKEEAISDLHAWSFTAESQTGKRLVARCKKLLQENEEFGKMVTSGNVAKLNTEIAMQKRLIEEMHANEKEYDALVLEMDEELDLLTCACKQLQNKLYESVRLNPSSGKDVPAHKLDGKQSTRRAAESSSHLITRQVGVPVQQDVYKPNACRQRETITSPTLDHNGVMTSKRAVEAGSKTSSGMTSKHSTGTRLTSQTGANAAISEQETIKQPSSPRTNPASRHVSRNTHHGKDESSPRPPDHTADLKAPDGAKSAESDKSAPPATGKVAKQAAGSQESPVDDHTSKVKAKGLKSSGAKDDVPQKQSDSGEKRRKPASNEGHSQAAQSSNPPKNKRRARRLSSEEQERHASKIQNLGSSKENQCSSLVESQSKQENSGDGTRHSPVPHSSPGVPSSRTHRPAADQNRRPAVSKSTKVARANWEMDHSLSPGHGRQRDGIRSSVNKTSTNVSKTRGGQGMNGSSGRKLDGRRSSPAYRYGEPRRRRHSPTRNYR